MHFPKDRQWHPTPVLLPGKSHGWRSLVGCSPWGRQELDTTEQIHFHFSLSTFMHWKWKWQLTPVFLPGEPQGWGSLVVCRLWGHTESDTTEVTQQQQQQQQQGQANITGNLNHPPSSNSKSSAKFSMCFYVSSFPGIHFLISER